MSKMPSTETLPIGWVSGSLGEFCEMYQPKTISTKDLVEDGEFPVYGANGQIGFYDKYNHEDSEVTVTCRGATCGTVNVIPAKSWITGNAMVVRPIDNCMSKQLLSLQLQSLDFTQVITGTAQPQITRTTLTEIKVVLPSLDEQARIVLILEEQLSRLDAALASVRAVREKSARFRRSLLHAAFTGALTGHDASLGNSPKDWMKESVGDFVSIKTGKIDVNAAVENGAYPFFTCAREIYRIDEAPYEGRVVLIAGNGDLNVKYYEGKFNAYQRTYFLAVLDESKLLPKYLYQFMEMYVEHLRKISIGTTIKYIKLGDLRDATISLPPMAVQEKIVEILEEQLSRLESAHAVADAIEKKSFALRRSLLHAAFTGALTKEWREGTHV